MASRAISNDYVVPTYESDYAAWAFHQAMLLRSGQLHLLDRAWIAEELDSLGKHEFNRLESALRVLLTHILKWDKQPQRRSRSWANSIAVQRRHARRQLEENPSLEPRLEEAIRDSYSDARREASSETDLALASFAEACPYSWDDIMNRPFDWPEELP